MSKWGVGGKLRFAEVLLGCGIAFTACVVVALGDYLLLPVDWTTLEGLTFQRLV